MQLIVALANTFRATPFDVFFFLGMFISVFVLYYFVPLRRLYEVAFWAIVWLGVYILLRVLLLENAALWTAWGLLPFQLSVFLVSISVYLVFILAIIFPIQWGLVISETTNPILYTAQYLFIAFFVIFSIASVFFYMIEQTYVFKVGTIFIWLRDWWYYQQSIRISKVFQFIMSHQNIILPLGVLLMVYKLFLSNMISAIVLTVVYNLSRVWIYRKKDDSSYRVEFHEVGGSSSSEE